MDRAVAYVESVLILLTWCLPQQVFYANREFTSREKMHFLLFVTPFVPLVAAVLLKELILHLPSTACSSLLCGWDVHGPCTRSASGESATPCHCAATGGGLSGTLCCCGVTQHCGQRGSRGQGSLGPLLWPGSLLRARPEVPQIFETQKSG